MARVKVQVPIEQTEQQVQPVAAVEPQPVSTQRVQPHGLALSRGNLIALVLIGLALIMLFMLLNDRSQLKKQIKEQTVSQSATAPNDVQKYQEEIGKNVELPSGQTPSLVAVNDAKKLASENPFFKNAKDGDVVLLYVSPDKTVRAILYRPSTHKVIEATSSATIGTGTTTAPVKQ